jgi:hypothetical protein
MVNVGGTSNTTCLYSWQVRRKNMTLHDIAERIRNPVPTKPTPEELMLIRMIEKLVNAMKSTVVGR